MQQQHSRDYGLAVLLVCDNLNKGSAAMQVSFQSSPMMAV
jgi:hypothetical protein